MVHRNFWTIRFTILVTLAWCQRKMRKSESLKSSRRANKTSPFAWCLTIHLSKKTVMKKKWQLLNSWTQTTASRPSLGTQAPSTASKEPPVRWTSTRPSSRSIPHGASIASVAGQAHGTPSSQSNRASVSSVSSPASSSKSTLWSIIRSKSCKKRVSFLSIGRRSQASVTRKARTCKRCSRRPH